MRTAFCLAVVCTALVASACSDPERERIKQTTKPTYDKTTGKLTELTVNAYEKGNLTTALQDRPALDFKVNVLSDRPTPNK